MSNQFSYKYSAPTDEERKEIDSIRKRYVPEEQVETKMDKLRRLDGIVKNSATVTSLCFGVIGTLIMGTGMTMVLELGIVAWGIVVGIIGVGILSVAYPVYKAVLRSKKKKYGDIIIKLTEELLSEQKEEQK